MPPKAKHALASLSAAHKTLDDKFGENKMPLVVAADCGACVAITFERFCAVESFVLATDTRKSIEKAMVVTAASAKDESGRRIKIRNPVIIHGGRVFEAPHVPHPELRQALASVAPSFNVFSDALDHLQRLHDVSTQLASFYTAHPEQQDLLHQLTNAKKLMTVYVMRAAPSLGITRTITTTELAALAIVIGIEEAGSPDKLYIDNWRKVRAAVPEIEALLGKLPSFKFLW